MEQIKLKVETVGKKNQSGKRENEVNETHILSFSSELLRCLIDIIIILQKAIYGHEIFPKYMPPWFVEKI